MAHANEILELLGILTEAYPTFTLTDGRTALYVDMLSDLDTPALAAAVRQHIATVKFPPTVAELRDLATRLSQPPIPSWADAWDEVLRQIGRVGNWGTARFSHPLIQQAVDGMGGWQLMCGMEVSETATWRAQFRDVFNAYASRADNAAKLLPSSREVAARYGALPPPRQENVPQQLPAPAEPQEQIDDDAPLRFAERIRKWREEGREEREAESRAKVEAWQKEQTS